MEDKGNYGLFNGRRNADNYVKAYLKGVVLISGAGLTIILAFAGWVSFNLNQLHEKSASNDMRITKIESSRFTTDDGASLKEQIHDNKVSFSKLNESIKSIKQDLDEIKMLLKRSIN